MCTAVSYMNFFGRNLDWAHSFGEEIIITPRLFPLKFKILPEIKSHYAIIGAAKREDNYPLYFDAVNEAGLAISGLNFPDADYKGVCQGCDNVAPFEFIPYILSKCDSIESVKKLLSRTNICNIPFSDTLGNSPLHWLIYDGENSLTAEQTKSGLAVTENRVGVLTNNPPFNMQLFYLSNFLNLSASEPENKFSDKIKLSPKSRGMGAFSLPGDFSSHSRFVKAAFVLLNSPEGKDITQFFHILSSVSQVEGSVKCDIGNEKTIYSSCMDLKSATYYFKTYENSRISAVSMRSENLGSEALISYPFSYEQDIFRLN